MSKNNFTDVINSLNKPQDSKELLKILIAIRKEVEWPKNSENILKIQENDCLRHFLKITDRLRKKPIIDVCLSILGNCMMEESCARKAMGVCNILPHLNQLLKRYPQEDSINGRIFRIIGNLCPHMEQWADVIINRKPQLVTYIVEFIKNISQDELPVDARYSEATILMSLRSLKGLLNGRTVIILVKSFAVLKAVGSLFIKLSIGFQKDKSYANLLNSIIHLLYDYSRYKCYASITDLRTTERGDSLSYLCSVLLLSPKRIVKMLMNFIEISQLKSELPIPEICEKIMDEILKEQFISDEIQNCMEYIQCICYLLDHPAIRNTERCRKCIPILVKILDSAIEPTNIELESCILIVKTLSNCEYDSALIQEQLDSNVIGVLVRKLQLIVGTSDKLDIDHKKVRKRKNDCFIKNLQWLLETSETTDKDTKRNCRNHSINMNVYHVAQSSTTTDDSIRIQQLYNDDEMPTFVRYDRSPSPCSSTESDLSGLAWSSPMRSPTSLLNDLSECDSDDYSPVCSEADSNEFSSTEDTEEIPIVQEKWLGTDVDNENAAPYVQQDDKTRLKTLLLTKIIILLNTLCKINPPVPELGNEELLMCLIKCSDYYDTTPTSQYDSVYVIHKILSNNFYLIPIMRTRIVETIYKLTQIQHTSSCSKCNEYKYLGYVLLTKITHLAETGVGKGDIAHVLLRGSREMREQMVLIIPYIIRDKHILARLMMNCGGLKVLTQLLKGNIILKDRSVKVLCMMAREKLQIANPRHVAINLTKKVIKGKYEFKNNCENVVVFKLDDGTNVRADREFLCKKSDFFNSLLNGHFKESTENEINLPNVNSKSLQCLLQLLIYVDKLETIDIQQDLDTILDVLVLSDRYLLPDVCASVTNCVEKFKLTSKTVPNIYKWSIESGTNLLRVESIAFALVSHHIIDDSQIVMFDKLFNLGYSDELIEDIEKLLIRYMNPYTGCYSTCILGKPAEVLNSLKM